jgi:hypothetical protein
MPVSNKANTVFRSAVHLNPDQTERWVWAQNDPRYNEEMSLGNYHLVNILLEFNGLPKIQILRPELFVNEALQGDTFELKVPTKGYREVYEKLHANHPVSMEFFNSLRRGVPEMTDQLYYISLNYDVSGSMQEHADIYPILDRLYRDGLCKSLAYTKRATSRTVIKVGSNAFNHEQTVLQAPVDLVDYKPMTEAPKLWGCTDLRTQVALMLRNVRLLDEVQEVVGAREVHIAQAIFSDGAHFMDNAGYDSVYTMKDLQTLYRDVADENIVAISCCDEATKFYEEIGFVSNGKNKNLLFVKDHQDRDRFKKSLRNAIAMWSDNASAQISKKL